MKLDPYPILPEWLAVAAEYEARGVAFPMDDVKHAVWGEDYDIEVEGLGTFRFKAGSRRELSEGCAPFEELAELHDRISRLPKNTFRFSNRDVIAGELYLAALCAASSRSHLERIGWKPSPDGDAKARQIKGAGNRPESYSRYLIRKLYNALRPAFDQAWPELADIGNPRTLREHLAAILSPLELGVDLSPDGRGTICNAIQHEIRRRSP